MSASVVSTRTRKAGGRKDCAAFLAGCTDEERAYCVRLVRLLRENYWVSTLVRQILDKEAQNPYKTTIKWFRNLLEDFDTIEALAYNAQRLGNRWSEHPICKAIRQKWGDEEIAEYKSERAIQSLVESASQTIRSQANGG